MKPRINYYLILYFQPKFLAPNSEVFVESAIRTLGWCNRTCGYWAHSLHSRMIPSMTNPLHVPLMKLAGKDEYEYAISKKAKKQ